MEGSQINSQDMPDRVIRMELISFFIKYPDTVGTAESLSELLGMNGKQVKRQMDELVQLDILQKSVLGDAEVYAYIPAISKALSRRRPKRTPAEASNPEGHTAALVEMNPAVAAPDGDDRQPPLAVESGLQEKATTGIADEDLRGAEGFG